MKYTEEINTSVTLVFKFQLLPMAEGFQIYSTFKSVRDRTVHQGRVRWK
jgi:hypothetical protein